MGSKGKDGVPVSTESVDRLMEQAVADGVFPGGILLAARGEDRVIFKAVGSANLFRRSPIYPDTVFDLASLTKPLATTLVAAYLFGKSSLDLDEPLSDTIPSLANTAASAITYRHLLTHTSGLPDYRPYFEALLRLPPECRKPELHRLLESEALIHPVGEKTVYSDIGFLLLQYALETRTGCGIDRFLADKIYEPLAISDLFFIPTRPEGREYGYAATEESPARGLVEGVVHDENAWVIGGVGGHAGLFGTAVGVYQLLRRLLDDYSGRSAFFGQGTINCFLDRPDDTVRALGFDVPSLTDSSAGKYFDRRHTVGHLGFTGTSFWMDVRREIIVVLLTNRVHPTRSNQKIRQFRPVIHDAVMKLLNPSV